MPCPTYPYNICICTPACLDVIWCDFYEIFTPLCCLKPSRHTSYWQEQTGPDGKVPLCEPPHEIFNSSMDPAQRLFYHLTAGRELNWGGEQPSVQYWGGGLVEGGVCWMGQASSFTNLTQYAAYRLERSGTRLPRVPLPVWQSPRGNRVVTH